MIQQLSDFIGQQAGPFVTSLLGDGSFLSELFASNPLLIPVFFIILPAVIFFGVALFVDFIKDSWKMPIGIVLDLIAVALYSTYPTLLILFAFVAAAAFFILSLKQKFWKIVYTIIGLAKMLILVPFIPIPDEIKIIIVFIPIYTVAMFFLCITD